MYATIIWKPNYDNNKPAIQTGCSAGGLAKKEVENGRFYFPKCELIRFRIILVVTTKFGESAVIVLSSGSIQSINRMLWVERSTKTSLSEGCMMLFGVRLDVIEEEINQSLFDPILHFSNDLFF